MKPRETVCGRFGGFAVGHFALVLLYVLFAPLPRAEISVPSPLSQVLPALSFFVPVLCYLPVGWVVSRLRRWPAPDRKTAFLSVLFPTLCAWGWVAASAGVGIFGSLAGIPALEGAGSWMLFSTLFWATPSALFVGFALVLSLMEPFFWLWLVCIPLAGLLPPLLFYWGSLLPHRFCRPRPPALPEGGAPT